MSKNMVSGGTPGAVAETMKSEIARVIVGQKQVVEEILIALISGGHVLLVGVPGLAKTLLVRTVADVMELSFSRIQFTPDLMPSDITGTDILDNASDGKRVFRFIKGPIFANVVLADEINRTPPKTQAALLQAMQEGQVTAAGHTYELDRPFFVLATQNPIEQEGTYPLPEAQLDRFMFEIKVGYPSEEEELKIVKEKVGEAAGRAKPVISAAELLNFRKMVDEMPLPDHVVKYAVELVRASRPDSSGAPDFIKKWVGWGAGPRASQYLVRASMARALIHGRNAALVDDIRALVYPVLRHRIIPNFSAEA